MSELILVGIIAAAALLGGGGYYVWTRGLLGTGTESRLKQIRGKVAEWSKHELERLDRAIANKIAKRLTKEQAVAPALAPAAVTEPAPRSKEDRIAEYRALLNKQLINEVTFNRIVEDVLKE